MTKNRDIIPELLSEISTYLSNYDCFNCMTVSRHWYSWFKLQFYKKVLIKNNSQFDRFLQTITASSEEKKELTQGYLIKELRLISADPAEEAAATALGVVCLYHNGCPVILTQEKLDLLSDLCPRLERLEFDISQWINLNNMSTFKKWKNLTMTAPMYCRHIDDDSFVSTLGSRLTRLRVSYTSHAENQLFTVLPNMLMLKDLVLDIFCTPGSVNTVFDVTHYLLTLHKAVSQLETLSLMFTNSLMETPDPSVLHDQTKLKSLTLKGISNPSTWFHYISNNYRFLKSLNIIQPTIKNLNTFVHSDSLAQLVQRLVCLERLSLKGESAYYLYSDALANELSRSHCSIRMFDIDFNTYDLSKSFHFLNSIAKSRPKQLAKLQLRVWNQFVSWPGSIQDLYYCIGLVDLDLSFARGFMDPCQYTLFVIDEFTKMMPQIKRLSLQGADIQIGSGAGLGTGTGRDSEMAIMEPIFNNRKKIALQCLNLRHSRIVQVNQFCQFISDKCTNLNQLNVSRCEANIISTSTAELAQRTVCTLNFANSRLDELRVSTIFFYSGTLYMNSFLAVTVSIENNPDAAGLIWWLIKEDNHHVYPTYRLANLDERAEIEKHYRADGEPIGDSHLRFGVLNIYCKSLRCLYVDNIKMPFHHY